MINIMVIILCIGILSAVFGLLLVFAPNLVLRAERKANKLYMTDEALIKNRIPLGIAMLGASAFWAITMQMIHLRYNFFNYSNDCRNFWSSFTGLT